MNTFISVCLSRISFFDIVDLRIFPIKKLMTEVAQSEFLRKNEK